MLDDVTLALLGNRACFDMGKAVTQIVEKWNRREA